MPASTGREIPGIALSSEDDDETALWRRLETDGGSAARERLFSLHANFARTIARRHHREHSRGDIDLVDLYQHAYTGLLEAIDRFDPDVGAPFRAFAAHRISGSVLDGIARMSEVREQISWRRRVRQERLRSLSEAESGKQGTPPIETLAELAVGLALGFMLEGTGLFAKSEDDEAVNQAAETAYDSLAWKELVQQLQAEVLALPERERTILQEHYIHGVAFEQLASLLDLSKGRVSQLHRAALLLLRKRLREHGHFRMVR